MMFFFQKLLKKTLFSLVLITLFAIFSIAIAQTAYPSRPLKMMVSFPTGGGTDVFARAVAQGLSTVLGQQFIVGNKPGAGGVVASQSLLQTPADGYNLLMGSTSTQAIAPLLYSRRPYATADFSPIAHIASVGTAGRGWIDLQSP